jgi:hypothetical protein
MMKQHRALYRLTIDRTGELAREEEKAPCRVVDLTSEGVRLETALSVQPGDRLALSFALTPGKQLHCGIHVVAVTPPYLGARLTELSPDDHRLLNEFIEQFLDLNFMGL